MAALVRIAAHLRAVLAPHVPFQFMDRRYLRSPHDVEGNGLMRIAARAAGFEVDITSVQRVTQRGRRAAPDPQSRACACSTTLTRAGRLPCVLLSPLSRRPDRCAVKWFRVTSCPCERECVEQRWAGKPLQIAVDSAPGTQSRSKAGLCVTCPNGFSQPS